MPPSRLISTIQVSSRRLPVYDRSFVFDLLNRILVEHFSHRMIELGELVLKGKRMLKKHFHAYGPELMVIAGRIFAQQRLFTFLHLLENGPRYFRKVLKLSDK